ncbi:MAG: transcription antitermination factor NusB [Solobacterium sp.]|nr:transcription antitermination factor NusB [Solobacterium sp.]
MTRHSNREKALFATYQNQIMARSAEELIRDNFPEEEDRDEYIISVVRQAIEHTDRYRSYINEVLEGWSFDRLGYIEQAILLNGCAEFDLKQELAAVIIDEYVRLAKKYCDGDSYKLINGVLDRI